jgi:hypothetical protein
MASQTIDSIPRSWAQVKTHPAVQAVEVWPSEESKYWIYLKDEYIAASDPIGGIQQGTGRTIREAINDTFPVHVAKK